MTIIMDKTMSTNFVLFWQPRRTTSSQTSSVYIMSHCNNQKRSKNHPATYKERSTESRALGVFDSNSKASHYIHRDRPCIPWTPCAFSVPEHVYVSFGRVHQPALPAYLFTRYILSRILCIVFSYSYIHRTLSPHTHTWFGLTKCIQIYVWEPFTQYIYRKTSTS